MSLISDWLTGRQSGSPASSAIHPVAASVLRSAAEQPLPSTRNSAASAVSGGKPARPTPRHQSSGVSELSSTAAEHSATGAHAHAHARAPMLAATAAASGWSSLAGDAMHAAGDSLPAVAARTDRELLAAVLAGGQAGAEEMHLLASAMVEVGCGEDCVRVYK